MVEPLLGRVNFWFQFLKMVKKELSWAEFSRRFIRDFVKSGYKDEKIQETLADEGEETSTKCLKTNLEMTLVKKLIKTGL
ncbi:OLC1v1016561C1, partial [Oldenlandia corymbosa var. corymbosa]